MRNNNETIAWTLGVLGDFPGDAELILETERCGKSYCDGSDDTPPSIERLVSLLGMLPLKGRYAFVRMYLAKSPHRDTILLALFDYCFEEFNEQARDHEVDEFVLIATPAQQRSTPVRAIKPLNVKRFHIFQVVVVLMAVSGNTGVELTRRYLKETSSTKYRARLLIQCIESFTETAFSNEELWQEYQISPKSVQQTLVRVCKQSRKRPAFLERVHQQEPNRYPNILYWCNTEYVAKALDDTPDQTCRLMRWGSHGNFFVKYIRSRMEDLRRDKLACGALWTDILRRIDYCGMQPEHAKQLIQLLDEIPACYVVAGASWEARQYLESVSRDGEEDIETFEEVARYGIPPELLKKLTKRERLEFAVDCIRTDNWERFSVVRYLVPSNKLPFCEVHLSAHYDDLWSFLNGSSKEKRNEFFDLFADTSILFQLSNDEQAKFLRSWADLHFRCQPSASMATSAMWQKWYSSILKFHSKASILSLFTKGPLLVSLVDNALLSDQVQHAGDFVSIALKAYGEASSRLSLRVSLEPMLVALHRIPWLVISDLETISAGNLKFLVQDVIRFIVKTVLPCAAEILQFDPCDTETYVSSTNLQFFDSTLSSLLRDFRSFHEVVRACTALILDTCNRASLRENESTFVVSNVQSGRRKLNYFNYSKHDEAITRCKRLAESLLEGVRKGNLSLDDNLTHQLWALVSDPLIRKSNPVSYLDLCCSRAPQVVLQNEKTSIVEKSRSFMLSVVKENHRWRDELSATAKLLEQLGCLELVLNDEGIPTNVAHSLLIDHAGFDCETSRQNLQDLTFGSDAQSRVTGVVNWMKKACATDSLKVIDEAFAFAVARIKNEAGMNRKVFFNWIMLAFPREIVLRSLQSTDVSDKDITSLATSILSIQQQDLSRLDSVSGQCLHKLPCSIMQVLLLFDPSQTLLSRRRVWIRCSMRLHWELQAASHGDEGLLLFSWPFSQATKLAGATNISKEAFETLYPRSNSSTVRKVRFLQSQVDLPSLLLEGFEPRSSFSPSSCVEVLVEELNALWNTRFSAPALLTAGRFHDDKTIAKAQRCRLFRLIELCGTSWREVQTLVLAFDNVFRDIESSPPSHIEQASQLLDSVWGLYNDPRPVADDPHLAEACDRIFRFSLVPHSSLDGKKWLDRWTELYMLRGTIRHSTVAHRLKNFVYTYCGGCEPDAFQVDKAISSLTEMQCSMVRDLISASPNALSFQVVRETLFRRRQDILVRCFKDIAEENMKSVLDEVLDVIESRTLLSCHSDLSQWFGEYALDKATNKTRDLASKIDAARRFMKAPTTQHADVLAALSVKLDDAVRETVINSVFDLDSPFHILGHLLSQKSMQKIDQRVTARLLTCVSRHVHVDKVVQVISLLLATHRRCNLSFQLHKAVVRMLFEARTPDTTKILRSEWDQDIPNSVRSLMITKSVEGVAAGKIAGLEVSVISSVATSRSIEMEMKFLLLAPKWSAGGPGLLRIQNAEGVATDEILDLFRRKAPVEVDITEPHVARAFRLILQQLEESSEGTLRFLATMKRLSLSDLFSRVPDCGQSDLCEMMKHLDSPASGIIDHKRQVGCAFVAGLFGMGAMRVINQSLDPRKHIGFEKLREHCEGQDTVRQIRTLFRTQLAYLLDLPARKSLERSLVSMSLKEVSDAISRHAAHTQLSKVLISSDLSDMVGLLQEDGRRILSLRI